MIKNCRNIDKNSAILGKAQIDIRFTCLVNNFKSKKVINESTLVAKTLTLMTWDAELPVLERWVYPFFCSLQRRLELIDLVHWYNYSSCFFSVFQFRYDFAGRTVYPILSNVNGPWRKNLKVEVKSNGAFWNQMRRKTSRQVLS